MKAREELLKEISEQLAGFSRDQLENLQLCLNLVSRPGPPTRAELVLLHYFTSLWEWGSVPGKQREFEPSARGERISLPQAELRLPLLLSEVLMARRSRREYVRRPISLQLLSNLLFYTYGQTRTFRTFRGEEYGYRSAPSAGALYPIDLFVASLRVQDLEPGLYRYTPEHHVLESYLIPIRPQELVEAGIQQTFIADAALLLILVASPRKLFWKYGVRGYRYLLLDAGHVAQNAYLAAEALDLGACEIGAFYDDHLNTLFRFDGENSFIVSFLTIGVKKEDDTRTDH